MMDVVLGSYQLFGDQLERDEMSTGVLNLCLLRMRPGHSSQP